MNNEPPMKKLFLVLVALMMVSGSAYARKAPADETYERNEISFSVGRKGAGEVICSLMEVLTMGFYIPREMAVFYPPLSVQYIRYVKDKPYRGRLGFGVQMAYQYVGSDDPDNLNRFNYISIIPTLKVYLYADNVFGVYGKLGGGAAIGISPDSESTMVLPAENVCLGADAGGPRFKAYLELGCGYQGFAALGLKYSF